MCAAKPYFPCIDLTRLIVKAKPKDEYVTKKTLGKQPTILTQLTGFQIPPQGHSDRLVE